jgi:Tfp pilus assembly protein PilW
MSAPRASFPRPARRAAFSLVEIMIGASIGSFVLLGILTAFVTLGRNGARLYNYNTMETESRRALDEFSQDVRMASGIVWNSATSVTLTVPDNYAAYGNQVTYAYDSATTGATRRTFYRVPGNPSTTYSTPPTRTALARNVTSCTFARYNRNTPAAPATTDAETKRLQVTMKISVTTATTVAATENAISATYLLRNKLSN